MKKTFSLDVESVDIQEINNGDFLKLKMYVISNGINRNRSEFVRESFESGMSTMYNKPILAYFNKKLNDTEEHNSELDMDDYGNVFYDYDYEGAEKPVGVVPESANIYIETIDNKDWIVIDSAYVWTEYNKRLTNLIKRQIKKKVSVEVEALKSHDDGEVEKITSWKFLGVTILGKAPTGEEIVEGIEGAKLILKDYADNDKGFSTYKTKFNFALNKKDILLKYGVKKEDDNLEFKSNSDYGTGESIKVNKSKDAVSNDSWGAVDKTKLRNTVLKASNYKSIVKSVYLDVQDGWEESPSEHLKYPVMQYKDGEFVYNANGLLSAQQYGEKYDKSIANKALSIRKKLGLLKKEETMKKFIEDAKSNGFVCLGLFGDKLAFAKEVVCSEDKEEMSAKEELSVFEVEKEKAEEYACDDSKDFAWDELTGKSVKMAEDDDDDDEEKKELAKKVESLEEEKKDMAAKIEESEKDKKEMAEKLEEKEKELTDIKMAKFKEDTDAILSDEDEDMDEKTHEELVKMREDGKFSSIEDFKKELAYRKYIKTETVKKNKKNKLDYSNMSNKTGASKKTLIDALDEI